MMGININDKAYPFTQWIMNGNKTVETRCTPSLDPYVGKRVGIVRTGKGQAMLVGYATIGKPIKYTSVKAFRADENRHMVAPGSIYDIKEVKYGYPLEGVESLVCQLPVYSNGIIARNISCFVGL